MKKSITFKLYAFALMAVMVSACSKYEEGSKFTVLTKKSRIVNVWKVSSVTVNGIDVTVLFGNTESVEMKKDGTMTTSYVLGATEEGLWNLSGDKLELVTFDSNGNESRGKIIKLKKDELKLEYTEPGSTIVLEYVTK